MDRIILKSRYLLENLTEGGAIILVSAAIVTGEFLIRLRTYGAYIAENLGEDNFRL